ncbi:DUF2604 domain-containing protein [Rubellimicrobium roseum]|uniref:DUF2604 domain-containing protein n=1 Tax=Rubellimicrobium roseum TaxID=687525 RepID=A0A5C4NC14_9RHOB|nr:DUF2604 domain-containing protein [Rubellimicrobium roseum]TNC65783.1 DUF2604 domain-containing protein [Rubellimicrobium roseum]
MSDKSNHKKGDDHGDGGDKKVDLTLVVSSTEVTVKAKLEDTLLEVAEIALKKSENLGRPVADWVLRKEDGEELDLSRTVASYGFNDGDLLSLALKAGVAG